jgi:hypothetical protein
MIQPARGAANEPLCRPQSPRHSLKGTALSAEITWGAMPRERMATVSVSNAPNYPSLAVIAKLDKRTLSRLLTASTGWLTVHLTTAIMPFAAAWVGRIYLV